MMRMFHVVMAEAMDPIHKLERFGPWPCLRDANEWPDVAQVEERLARLHASTDPDDVLARRLNVLHCEPLRGPFYGVPGATAQQAVVDHLLAVNVSA